MRLLAAFLVLASAGPLAAQERPAWVGGGAVPGGDSLYLGIGHSALSSDEADQRARVEFAMNVETRVRSLFQDRVREQGEDLERTTNMTTEAVSTVSLRGIVVTERFRDSLYHSLIAYRKDVYDSLASAEVRRELDRTKRQHASEEEMAREELRARMTKDSLAAEARKADLHARQEQLRLDEQHLRQEKAEAALRREMYAPFFVLPPPDKAVTIRNGQLTEADYAVGVNFAVSPFDVSAFHGAVRLWLLEISVDGIARDKKLHHEEAFAKVQILPGVGEDVRTTLAIGAVQSLLADPTSSLDFKASSYSLFVAGTVSLPALAWSYASFYADKHELAAGMNTCALFTSFKNHLSLVADVQWFFDRDLSDRYRDALLAQAGVRFQATASFSTTVAYENNRELVVSFDVGF